MRLPRRLRKDEDRRVELLAVIPPRTGERTLVGIENLLQAIAVEEPFSLELAGTSDGVSFLGAPVDAQYQDVGGRRNQ